MQKGKSYILYVNIGTDTSPNYLPVGGQRDFSRTRSASSIDAGCKLDTVRKKIPGDIEETLRQDGLYVENDAAWGLLKGAFYAKSLVLIKTYNLGVPVEQMLCSITGLNESHPDQGVSTYSIELQLASDPVPLSGT